MTAILRGLAIYRAKKELGTLPVDHASIIPTATNPTRFDTWSPSAVNIDGVCPTTFTVAPIVFGLDKFANLLTYWPQYLAGWIDGIVPGTAQQAMYAVGVVEIIAGILVAIVPRWGALVVAAWLLGIIVNLVTLPGYFDVALRDLGLLAGALALSLLARRHPKG